MTTNRILPPIHIHPILIIFILISFVTGTFLQLFIILSIVLFHELGHYGAAKFFKWRIKGIMLWIFGGVMDTDEHGSRPFHEDIIVTIAGPLQHLFIYLFLYIDSLGQIQFISIPIWEMVFLYNTIILLFNLLPIWPLDGGKIAFFILAKYSPFRKAYDRILILSMLACVLILGFKFVFFTFHLGIFLIMIFLLKENKEEWDKRYYVFLRFLLKRYQGDASVQKVSPISVLPDTPLMGIFKKFYKNRKHPIYVSYPNYSRSFFDENDCLRVYFHDKQVHVKAGDLKKHLVQSGLSLDIDKENMIISIR